MKCQYQNFSIYKFCLSFFNHGILGYHSKLHLENYFQLRITTAFQVRHITLDLNTIATMKFISRIPGNSANSLTDSKKSSTKAFCKKYFGQQTVSIKTRIPKILKLHNVVGTKAKAVAYQKALGFQVCELKKDNYYREEYL